jgi:hypothetical protein
MSFGTVVVALLLACPSAAPGMTPPPQRPAQVGVLAPASPTPVELRSVRTRLECVSEPERRCAFEMRYHLHNPTPNTHRLELFSDGYRIGGVELTVDGARRAGRAIERGRSGTREIPASTWSTRVFQVEVKPGATPSIVVTGTLNARPPQGAVATTLPMRHPLLGGDPGPVFLIYAFDLEPAERWAGEPSFTFETSVPENWELTEPPVDDEPVDPEKVPVYSFRARVMPQPLQNGGPYVGLGGALDEPRGIRGRLGYEIGYGLWTVYGLAVDTDFSSQVIIAPSIHAATAGWACVFPSFGMGIGPAVRLGDHTTIGGRIQAEIQFPFVGVVGHMDWYPTLDAPDVTDFAILGRFSL